MANNSFTFLTISENSTSEFKDRGSKFLGYAFSINSIEDFKTELKKIKELHPKATHHCFAYKLGVDGNNFRASDDGEPSGSAGKPILGQLESAGITNVLIVVVRYYGGTMLGVPGLINAYKTCAKVCIDNNTIVEKDILEIYELEFDYTIMNEIMRVLKNVDAEYKITDGNLFCKMIVKIPKKHITVANDLLSKIRNLQYKVLNNEIN